MAIRPLTIYFLLTSKKKYADHDGSRSQSPLSGNTIRLFLALRLSTTVYCQAFLAPQTWSRPLYLTSRLDFKSTYVYNVVHYDTYPTSVKPTSATHCRLPTRELYNVLFCTLSAHIVVESGQKPRYLYDRDVIWDLEYSIITTPSYLSNRPTSSDIKLSNTRPHNSRERYLIRL